MNFGLLLAIGLGFLIGTLPTAWIVMRKARGIDIRTVGSGNVGARNTYDVSGSRSLGILVMLIDAGKGVLAVALTQLMFDQWYLASGMAAAACVAGHNYNPWLGFKGGRGLATAAGAWLWLSPLSVVLWGLMYLTGYYVIRRDMHVGAMTGTLGLAVLILGTPDRVLRVTSLAMVGDPFDVKISVLFGCLFIFLRHVAPIRAVIAAAAAEPDDDQD